MHRITWIIAGHLLMAPVFAATQPTAQPNSPVTVLQHPGGGTIAYAQIPNQPTLRGAASRVLLYVRVTFGKPTITHVMKSQDGTSLAITFTAKSTQQGQPDTAGLALVAVRANGPSVGAVLSDRADRFGTTVNDMLAQMRAAATGTPASGETAATAPSSSAPQPPAPPALQPAATIPAATIDASAKNVAQLPATLQQTQFPDGSGSIGLPDGWKISAVHAGNVIAQGPGGAGLHFNNLIAAYDPTNAASKYTRPTATLLAIPYSTDFVTKWKTVMTAIGKQTHQPLPSITILSTDHPGAPSGILIAQVGASAGGVPMTQWVQVRTSPMTGGYYSIVLYLVTIPQSTSAQSQEMVGAIFKSYRMNQDVVTAQSQQDFQKDQAEANIVLAANRRAFIASEQSFAADDKALLGNTVIADRDYNAHGTVSNDLAGALIQADPNRFQEVPASQYVAGVDYIQ